MTDKPVLMYFDQLAGAIGARLISPQTAGGARPGFTSVSIDSRTVQAGALFVALIGGTQDGHRYAETALAAGAAGVMAARSRLEDPALDLEAATRKRGAPLLVVEDTLRGLQDAARVYLEGFPGLLRVGITGSSGKTTTKEIAAAMIGREKSVVINPGNLNSETGLPLAVFGVRSHHEVGIFEMGMNRRGEIAELARVLKPRIALITNIGSAHVGILGSRQEIAREKKAIFSEFRGNETALIPEDDDYRDFLAEGLAGRTVFYGPESVGEWGTRLDLGLDGTELTWEGVPVRFTLPGRHNLRDALAAAAIAREIPLSAAAIRAGLGSVKPLFGRCEIIRGPVTVFRDCYNANPESMAEAIALCDELDWSGRRVYIIGSMLELGDESAAAHAVLGRTLAASRADLIILYGEETKSALASLKEAEQRGLFNGKVYGITDRDGLFNLTADLIRDGDLVLLKGSRGCALEQLTGILTAETAAAKGVV